MDRTLASFRGHHSNNRGSMVGCCKKRETWRVSTSGSIGSWQIFTIAIGG